MNQSIDWVGSEIFYMPPVIGPMVASELAWADGSFEAYSKAA
jgi:hypothetical protein